MTTELALSANMIGSPFYYDVLFDDGPGSHDCMWSGSCTCCIQLVQQQEPQVHREPREAPVTVVPSLSVSPELDIIDVLGDDDADNDADNNDDNLEIPSKNTTPRPQIRISKRKEKKTRSAKTISSTAPNSAESKKLRHREVEKNRHRQLQAMVKTLSEKIPGQVDKETQVQTMKRAARYCVYLRDVVTTLLHSQVPMTQEKLERIYSRSCDSVEQCLMAK